MMPECPNCLLPRATEEDDAIYRAADDESPPPDGWPDHEGSHICWDDLYPYSGCERAEGYDLSPAEIRDLRAGFAACWAEVEALQRDTAVAWEPLLAIAGVLGFCGAPDELPAAVRRLTRERDEAQAACAPAMLEELRSLRVQVSDARMAMSLAGFGGDLLAQVGAALGRLRSLGSERDTLRADLEATRDALAKCGSIGIDILRRQR